MKLDPKKLDKNNKTLLELKNRSVDELRKVQVTDTQKGQSFSEDETVKGQVSNRYVAAYILTESATMSVKTQPNRACPVLAPLGQGVRALTLTCDELHSIWSISKFISTQIGTRFSPFRRPSQRKLK